MTVADATLDGINITRWGHGPAVVMVHGGVQGGPQGGASQWAWQRPLADEGWQLVLPDRPGHGKSPSRGPESIERDAQWLVTLLGDDGAHLVGHSYGGAISLCAAGLRPEAVHSLTLIETPIFSIAPHRPEVQEFRARIERATATKNRLLALVRLMRAVNIPITLLKPRPGPREGMQMAKAFGEMQPPYEWDASAALDTVKEAGIPLLAVTGGWSPGFDAIADELATFLDGERLTIDAGHHFPQALDGPDGNEFNAALATFLAAHQAGPQG